MVVQRISLNSEWPHDNKERETVSQWPIKAKGSVNASFHVSPLSQEYDFPRQLSSVPDPSTMQVTKSHYLLPPIRELSTDSIFAGAERENMKHNVNVGNVCTQMVVQINDIIEALNFMSLRK